MLQKCLLLIAVAGPPLLLRLVQVADQGVRFDSADLRGLLSDLLVSLAVYALACWLLTRARAAAVLVVLLWCLLNFANYEHVSTLGASADLGQAAYFFDKTFFLGSVLSPSAPLLLILMLAGVCGILIAVCKLPAARTGVWPVALMGFAAALAMSQLPVTADTLGWRQANVFEENTRRLLQSRPPEQSDQLSQANTRRLKAIYTPDLSGSPFIELPTGRPNVILVILEAISGVHLESLADVHGIDNSIKLPALDQLARRNLSYSSFVTHNRQTNRGEYAILCGDLPVLINAEPKMTRALGSSDLECLPKVLRSAGYRTAYLQAAPLGFMSKDSFMPLAGFDEVYGDSWFSEHYARNQWGIDDRAFLAQSVDKIVQLDKSGDPWFVTLLTVGTHHPYIVPEDFGERNFPVAAQYADRALADFLARIESLGILQNTLLVITSDESVGISGYRGSGAFTREQRLDDVSKKLADNWGFLIAQTAQGDRQRIDEVFSQSDIALSILDYLGLSALPHRFIGRSLFRQYDSGRPVVFGNLYKRYLGTFTANGDLQLCMQGLAADCERFALPQKAAFSPERRSLGVDPEAAPFLQAVIVASEDQQQEERVIALSHDQRIPLNNTPAMQVIFGGQYLSTPPHSLISVTLDVTLTGQPGEAQLGILLQSDQGNHFGRTFPPLGNGDRLTLSFDYYSPEALESLALIGTVVGTNGEELALELAAAELRIEAVPAAERHGEARLSIHSPGTPVIN